LYNITTIAHKIRNAALRKRSVKINGTHFLTISAFLIRSDIFYPSDQM